MNEQLSNTPEADTCAALSRCGGCVLAPSRQRGVALMALLALLLLVGAGVLIQRVNARVNHNPQLSAKTGDVLKQAKTALIARAVIDSNRPGELPCPDVNYDGSVKLNEDYAGGANSPCSRLLGWLPWRTLGMADLRDASGSRLWYGLSDSWHAGHSQPLNPDTTGGLTLNGSGDPDIVAVIIAPGTDLQQDSDPRPDATSTAMDATSQALVQKFLEATNSDGTTTTYVNQVNGAFNDRLVVITRAELIAAVQRRVAGELAVALSDYRATNGRYPWLSNNPDPLGATPDQLHGTPGVRNGHFAYIDTPTTIPYSFETGFTVSWDKNSVDDTKDKNMSSPFGFLEFYVPEDDKDKMKDAVKDALKNASPVSVAMPASPGSGVNCRWNNNSLQVDCDYQLITTSVYTIDVCLKSALIDICPFWTGVPVNRTMVMQLHYLGTPTTSTTSGARTRDVQSPLNGPFQNSSGQSTVVSFTDADTQGFGFFASRTLTISDGDDADFNTAGLYAEPQSGGSLPGDLPAWIAANNWGPYLYVSYAPNFIPTGTGACTAGTDCLDLSVATNLSRNDVESVVVGSGVSVTGQTRVAGSTLSQFFEGINANGNDSVERKIGMSTFNDYVRLVSCASGPAANCR